MTTYPSVSVVILNWNGRGFLQEFLPSVCASTYPNLEIVLGDNASTDGSTEFVAANYPQVRIVSNEENYGFAGGYNRILDRINSDYFVLLNSDVAVEPGWIEPVISLFESSSKIAAIQPKIRSYHNKRLFEYAGAAGGLIDTLGYPFCRGRLFDTVEADEGQYDTVSEIFWASGAALFIRRSCWIETGGFDGDFFAHMEEIDLCWRLKNRGYRIMYSPESIVYHLGGGTLNAGNPHKTYLNFRNNLVLLQKNLPFLQAVLTIFARLWLDLFSLIRFLKDGQRENARAINKAHVYFFKHLLKNSRKARMNTIPRFNDAGLFKGSIVWEYFIRKKKTYRDL